MKLEFGGFEQHIIHIGLNVFTYHNLEQLFDHSLIYAPRILQSDVYDLVEKYVVVRIRGSVGLVYWVHPNMVIT